MEVDLPLQCEADSASELCLTESTSIGSIPATLLFDTGSTISTLTPNFYKKVKSNIVESKNFFYMDNTASLNRKTIYYGNFEFGKTYSITETDQYVVGKIPADDSLDGILGYYALDGFSYILDIKKMTVKVFFSCGGGPSENSNYYIQDWKNSTSVQSIMSSGALYIPISINGVNTYGLIDTGTDRTIISNSFAHKVGITDSDLLHDQIEKRHLSENYTQTVRIHKFNNMKIGSFTISGKFGVLESGEFPPPYDIDIGNDIWGKVAIFKKSEDNTVTLDLEN